MHQEQWHAIGDNPVAFLIPCHRVIRQRRFWTISLGKYKKTAMIGWEAAKTNPEN
jgi:AraC family transcriptional regulator of adaptative response/methylated-DNA-[protein]-cysteine methyltransferase